MYKYRCEKCGAHLDPGERCDCEKEKLVLIIPAEGWKLEDDEKLKRVFRKEANAV